MKQWEYLVDTVNLDNLDKRLASAGSLGWELLSLLPNDKNPCLFLAVFKKPSVGSETNKETEEPYDATEIKPGQELAGAEL